MVLMMPLLFLFFLEPIHEIHLDRELNSIEIYNNKIYCAPRTGMSIFELTESEDLHAISFTDDVNYRIYDFYVTPFAIYLNNGRSIEKFYFTSGVKETVYSATDISSFILTPADEIILADHQMRELVFLDFTNSVKFKEPNITIKDLQFVNGIIYTLTKKNIILFDEFGNILGEKKIPEKLNHIFVEDADIFLFSPKKKYFYRFGDDWEKVEFLHGITDMCSNNQSIVILDGSGSYLYFYNKSRIE